MQSDEFRIELFPWNVGMEPPFWVIANRQLLLIMWIKNDSVWLFCFLLSTPQKQGKIKSKLLK